MSFNYSFVTIISFDFTIEPPDLIIFNSDKQLTNENVFKTPK
jgi:hypothetical protein